MHTMCVATNIYFHVVTFLLNDNNTGEKTNKKKS